MNCKNFEAVISDLAREQMLEAHTRESALRHTEECAECLAMLEDERALTRGLRSFAASMNGLEAPASVEASLLAKFRERTVAAQAPSVVVQMPQRAQAWRRWYPHAVAAAVLLMFAVGGASVLRLREAASVASRTETAAPISNTPDKTTPVSSNPITNTTDDGEADSTEIAAAESTDENRVPGQKLTKDEVDAIVQGPTAQRRAAYQSVPKSKIDKSIKSSASGEIATEFMPVSYGDNLNEIDNGRIIRVEMPRSALAQFGIPVNQERANERIKADVLIGDDGMARAIRFVR